jgi:hypothetical protein
VRPSGDQIGSERTAVLRRRTRAPWPLGRARRSVVWSKGSLWRRARTAMKSPLGAQAGSLTPRKLARGTAFERSVRTSATTSELSPLGSSRTKAMWRPSGDQVAGDGSEGPKSRRDLPARPPTRRRNGPLIVRPCTSAIRRPSGAHLGKRSSRGLASTPAGALPEITWRRTTTPVAITSARRAKEMACLSILPRILHA